MYKEFLSQMPTEVETSLTISGKKNGYVCFELNQ